ncbi:hypothetical protein K523DRAFT_282283 [Schizophyllum commune Tattone D]|nr:hypothetical protein K523DRAFT_282283 [Schizophyllum commune Tattone D]
MSSRSAKLKDLVHRTRRKARHVDIISTIPTFLILRITYFLTASDIAALSSTCKGLRSAVVPILFSHCWWKKRRGPPSNLWPFIRHLHVHAAKLEPRREFLRDLSQVTSLHVSGETITSGLASILTAASNLDTLDLSCMSWRGPSSPIRCGNRNIWPDHKLIPALPELSSRPTKVIFCSKLGPDYRRPHGRDFYQPRMLAQRLTFATLLHQLDVSRVEYLEVGLEALCLPCAVAYTWSFLHTLKLTGFWIQDPVALEDRRVRTPAWIYEHVHLGTLIASAPRLRVLRVQWRRAEDWCSENDDCPRPDLLWPADEEPDVPLMSLRELTLHNAAPADGIFRRLPPNLRTLSLLEWPHSGFATSARGLWHFETYDFDEDSVDDPPSIIMTGRRLMKVLAIVPLPHLRELRISFYGLEDMRLFDHIATAFPRLRVLEIHAETSKDCLWRKERLAAFAKALAPLRHLRILRINAFRDVVEDDPPSRNPDAGILGEDIILALFGPLHSVRELWLPYSFTKGVKFHSARRGWEEPLSVRRDEKGGVWLEPMVGSTEDPRLEEDDDE